MRFIIFTLITSFSSLAYSDNSWIFEDEWKLIVNKPSFKIYMNMSKIYIESRRYNNNYVQVLHKYEFLDGDSLPTINIMEDIFYCTTDESSTSRIHMFSDTADYHFIGPGFNRHYVGIDTVERSLLEHACDVGAHTLLKERQNEPIADRYSPIAKTFGLYSIPIINSDLEKTKKTK